MSVIVISGPEKAGKSTLAAALEQYYKERNRRVEPIRRWGRIKPDDRVYSPVMQGDTADQGAVHIWDRSWACEHVYARLLNRDRRLRHDPWLGEWLHGRAVQSTGVKVIVLAKPEVLMARRDDTDLPVNPERERELYLWYAKRFGWVTVDPTENGIDHAVRRIVLAMPDTKLPPPPAYAGPPEATVLVVGDRLSARPGLPGAWLPFSSRMTTEFGRIFHDRAFTFGWTNSTDVSTSMLLNREIVICCGKRALAAVSSARENLRFDQVTIRHPSYGYRWLGADEYEAYVRVRLHHFLGDLR